jgi:hypothetical protein
MTLQRTDTSEVSDLNNMCPLIYAKAIKVMALGEKDGILYSTRSPGANREMTFSIQHRQHSSLDYRPPTSETIMPRPEGHLLKRMISNRLEDTTALTQKEGH